MKITIVLPYFGNFNNYFELWMESCSNNKEINWLIFTDAEIPLNRPQNIRFVKTTLKDLKKYFEKKLNMNINLERPYKLCDYKPYYGYLFSEYLEDVDFWGYCDCDLIFGDLTKLINEEKLQRYDKILRTGHLSLIRNEKKINELFFKYNTYKMVLTSPAIYGYDESIDGYHLGFAGELLENGYKFWDDSRNIADIDFRHYPFYVVSDKQIPCAFVYDKGHMYKVIYNKGELYKKEMLYLHLQKRLIENNIGTIKDKYIICPNEIRPYDEKDLNSESFWKEISEERKNYYDKKKEKRELFKRDLTRLLHEPKKIDSILYRLKGIK